MRKFPKKFYKLLKRVRVSMSHKNPLKIMDRSRVVIQDSAYKESFGMYIDDYNQIILTNLTPKSCSIILAHEYGHFISSLTNRRVSNNASKYMKKIMDNKELTQEQKKIVYEEEVRAWRNGEHVLNTLGFRGWKTFDKYRSKYLTMYQRTLGIKP